MKSRIISLILCFVMLVSMIPAMVVNTSAYQLGDLNNDNKITALDCNLLTDYILGSSSSGLVTQMGDLDADSKVNAIDLNLLQLTIVGKYAPADDGYEVASLKLGGCDIYDYSIVLPEEYPLGTYKENAEYGAEIIQRYIKSACGITVDVAKSAKHAITFRYDESYGNDAFTIGVEDGNVSLTCGLARGPMYAAFGFAEDVLGYTFYPRDVVVSHAEEKISVEAGYTHTEGLNTSLAYRDSYTYAGVVGGYMGANNGKWKESTLALHNTANWTNEWKDAPKYGYSYGPLGAHSFSTYMPGMGDSEGMYCMTDRDAINLCAENVSKRIDSYLASGRVLGVNVPIITISGEDSSVWCRCRLCFKQIREHGGVNSASLIYFLNEVINIVTPKYPGVEFNTLAYWPTVEAPTNVEIPDNLYITFAPICHCLRHSLGDYCSFTTCPTTSYNDTAFILGWLKLTNNIFYWWYGANFWQSLIYLPELTWIYESVTYMNDVGLKGSFYQNDEQFVTFTDLQYYMACKIMWNPEMSKEEYFDIMRTACIDYYGSEKVYDLLMIFEDCREDKMWSDINTTTTDIYALNEAKVNAQYDTIFNLIDEIREEVTDADCLARFNRAVIGLQYDVISELHPLKYVNGSADEREIFVARYKDMYDALYKLQGTFKLVCEGDTEARFPDTFDPSVRPTEWYKTK